jgi:serine/threonine-protein phosphatase 6 regulatory ankyrin repeat subunit B
LERSWERAAKRGDAAGLRSLLDHGADVDARDRYGQTALMLAARAGHLAAVRVLVQAGAELDRTAKYRLSALMLAAINGHEEVARQLVEAGADIHIRGTGAPGFSEKTALDLAADLGWQAIVELLREREA